MKGEGSGGGDTAAGLFSTFEEYRLEMGQCDWLTIESWHINSNYVSSLDGE